ncbi:hypothetical protein BV25DRAFT_1822316 [Artomyces pyxidatus]|uniref:Uncharacterized protein n=1 Tax=Artomyces pyxidatus TaxID=48021 RepID=A0ACB8T8R7_9AGAM|nr:hypothetical protein BV25DRAFT_1822316 [Artomyces pyxidatus]
MAAFLAFFIGPSFFILLIEALADIVVILSALINSSAPLPIRCATFRAASNGPCICRMFTTPPFLPEVGLTPGGECRGDMDGMSW